MDIRRATPEDTEQICDLHRESIRRLCSAAYSAEQIAVWTGALAPERYLPAIAKLEFHVAESTIVLGFCILDPEHAELNALYVHPDAAGRGVGAALLAFVEEIALDRHLPSLTLKSTLNAVGFYGAHGFVRLREAVHLSPAGIELPCVEMAKELRPHSQPTRGPSP